MISEVVYCRVLLYEILCVDWLVVYYDVKNVLINVSCLVKIGNVLFYDKYIFGVFEVVLV